MLENVIDMFETYKTNEEIKQYEKEKQKYISTIKLFMVYGADGFYPNYYINGEQFINETRIDEQDIKKTLRFSKNAKKHFKEGLLSEDEEICEMMKYRYLTDVIEWEKDTEINMNLLRVFRYVVDCITGNIGYMFSMLYQIEEKESIDYDLIKETEMSVYRQLCKMLYFLGKKEEKY